MNTVCIKFAKVAKESFGILDHKTYPHFMVDACIAATATIHNLILITGNRKDYPMKELRLL